MNTDGSKYRILATICSTCKFPYLTGKDEAGNSLPCPICERDAEIHRLRCQAAKFTSDNLVSLIMKYKFYIDHALSTEPVVAAASEDQVCPLCQHVHETRDHCGARSKIFNTDSFAICHCTFHLGVS